MCMGGGGGSGASDQQAQIAQQQLTEQQQESTRALVEQQNEFTVNQAEAAQSLANTQALQAKNQAQVDQQAALTNEWQAGRAAEEKTATDTINSAFAQFTPDYYSGFTKAYTDHYQPQVEDQFGKASNQTTYGLARSGNLQAQTAADQFQDLSKQKGIAEDDINNAAIGATTNLKANVLNAKQNLMGQATSDATLGSPVTPGSADAISANFNQSQAAISGIRNTAGDTVTTLQATPQYSSLGQLFGAAASGVGAVVSGNNAYNYGQAFGGVGAANPTTASSGKVA